MAAWPRCSFEKVGRAIFLDRIEFEKRIEARWIWRAAGWGVWGRRIAACPRCSFAKVDRAICHDCIEFEKSIEVRWILRAGG